MNIEILEEKENPLLGRKEIRFRIDYKGKTPSFVEVRNELIKKVNADKTLTVIDSVNSDFGSQSAFAYAKIYGDEKSMMVEPGYRIEKNLEGKKKEKKPEAEKPVAEAKPAEEKAEKPAEGAKPEEPKQEEKKEEPKPEEKPAEEKPKEEPKEEVKPEPKEEKPVEVEETKEEKKDG